MTYCRRRAVPWTYRGRPGSMIALLADNRMAAHLHIAEGYVARCYCIKPAEFYLSTRGRAHVAEARHLIMYLAHVEIGMSHADIASRYHRDRSTVAYACRMVEDRRDDPGFDVMVSEIECLISLRGTQGFLIPFGDLL